jgi:hypothetical protein
MTYPDTPATASSDVIGMAEAYMARYTAAMARAPLLSVFAFVAPGAMSFAMACHCSGSDYDTSIRLYVTPDHPCPALDPRAASSFAYDSVVSVNGPPARALATGRVPLVCCYGVLVSGDGANGAAEICYTAVPLYDVSEFRCMSLAETMMESPGTRTWQNRDGDDQPSQQTIVSFQSGPLVIPKSVQCTYPVTAHSSSADKCG